MDTNSPTFYISQNQKLRSAPNINTSSAQGLPSCVPCLKLTCSMAGSQFMARHASLENRGWQAFTPSFRFIGFVGVLPTMNFRWTKRPVELPKPRTPAEG